MVCVYVLGSVNVHRARGQICRFESRLAVNTAPSTSPSFRAAQRSIPVAREKAEMAGRGRACGLSTVQLGRTGAKSPPSIIRRFDFLE